MPSWYLATEFQMFVITPFLFIPMWFLRKYYANYIWPREFFKVGIEGNVVSTLT